jgi:hypothetical protein
VEAYLNKPGIAQLENSSEDIRNKRYFVNSIKKSHGICTGSLLPAFVAFC